MAKAKQREIRKPTHYLSLLQGAEYMEADLETMKKMIADELATKSPIIRKNQIFFTRNTLERILQRRLARLVDSLPPIWPRRDIGKAGG